MNGMAVKHILLHNIHILPFQIKWLVWMMEWQSMKIFPGDDYGMGLQTESTWTFKEKV